jgi:hypothetical protein
MKEIHEFWISKDYYHLLPKKDAKFNGSNYILKIERNDPVFDLIGVFQTKYRKKNKSFFGFWKVHRTYTQKELETARLFRVKIKPVFEPEGEECGTLYDEEAACPVCGANRVQIGPLRLKKGSIPKKDIARTIAGEVVVSRRFADACRDRGLKGIMHEPVEYARGTSDHFQLLISHEVDMSPRTETGVNPFNFSEGSEASEFTVSGGYKVRFEKEVYKCPLGHTIGANLLSEAYVLNDPAIGREDFLASEQKIGGKQGVLRPEPLYFCSPAFRNMILEEKLKGFEFEIAHVEPNPATIELPPE